MICKKKQKKSERVIILNKRIYNNRQGENSKNLQTAKDRPDNMGAVYWLLWQKAN